MGLTLSQCYACFIVFEKSHHLIHLDYCGLKLDKNISFHKYLFQLHAVQMWVFCSFLKMTIWDTSDVSYLCPRKDRQVTYKHVQGVHGT
jgi:hypothetical protein